MAWLSDFHEHFIIGSLEARNFVFLEFAQLRACVHEYPGSKDPLCFVRPEDDGGGAEKWRDQMCTAYLAAGLDWPPELPDPHHQEDPLHPSGAFFLCSFLTRRAAELVWLFHHMFAFEAGDAEIEFLDVLHSYDRHMQHGENRSPWHPVGSTLLTHSIFIVRYKYTFDDMPTLKGKIIIRPIVGLESFQLIGFDHTYFRKDVEFLSSADSADMAGNAFSGFQISPMQFTALAGVAQMVALHKIWEEKDQAQDADSCSSSCDNG